MITQVSDIQKPQPHGTPQHHSMGHEIQVEGNEALHLRRLDGEVEKTGEKGAYAGGTDCEIFAGRWTRGGREGTGVEVEEVSLSLTTSILLTGPFSGDPSNI